MTGSEYNRKYVQKRTTRARRRAEFVGVLYFLGTLALTVLTFLPLVGEISWSYGALSLNNFWKPFTELSNFSSDRVGTVLNVLTAVLFALPILVGVIGSLVSLSKFDNLYMKGSRRIGYNQSYLALKKMGNIFSGLYTVIVFCSLALRLRYDVEWTLLFYFASAGFVVLHCLGGLVGGTVSRFSLEEGFVETPRKYGGFSPFLRNLFQLAAVAAMIWFLIPVNNLAAPMAWLQPDFFSSIASMTLEEQIVSLGYPALQILLMLFVFILFRHAVYPTEYSLDGPKAKGRHTVRFCSFMVLLLSLAFNGGIFYLAPEKNFEALNIELLYVSAAAFALFVIECIMRKFPLMKKKYKNAEDPEPIPLDDIESLTPSAASEPIPVPVATPVAPIFEGEMRSGIYVRPDGTYLMVMPILGNAAIEKAEEPTKKVTTVQTIKKIQRAPTQEEQRAYDATKKWLAAAQEKVEVAEGGFSAAAYVEANRHRLQPVEEKTTASTAPAPVPAIKTERKGKKAEQWQVKCPACGALHTLKKPNVEVTCKKCSQKFQTVKIKRA